MALNKNLSKEKIINYFLNALIALFSIVLMFSIYVGVQIKILNHDYANFFGYSMFEVQTDSMKDIISSGDWVIVKLNPKVQLKDIITFKVKDDYITHRVVEIHKGTYITQGDNNTGKDEPVDHSQVVGKVVKTLPGFGFLRSTLFNPIVITMLIVVLYLIDSLSKERKTSNKITKKIKSVSLNALKKFNKKESKNKKIMKESILPKLEAANITDDYIVVENSPEKEELLIIDEKEPSNEILINEESLTEATNVKEDSEITEVSMPEESLIDNLETIETDLDNREELEEYDYVADELEKTQFFRIIPVAEGELDTTLMEIAEYEMSEQNKVENNTVEEEIIPLEEEVEEDLTQIDLDLIKNNTRRNKNLIDAIMNIKKDEINEIVTLISNNEKLQTNEPTIKTILTTTYIHARYYNYFSEKDLEYRGKSILIKIDKILGIIADEMIKEYNGSDNKYEEKVKKQLKILKIFARLDQGKNSISGINPKREYYRNAILGYNKELDLENLDVLVNDIIKSQKTYDDITKYFLNKFETNTFYLDINQIKNRKKFHTVEIEHNINFSKVYSDYIIDKTYSEGIISEDKTSVLSIMLLSVIIKDMMNLDFEKKYIVNLSSSLYSKEKKLKGLLKAIDDEYAKSHILFLIDFQDIIENKKAIRRLRRLGYRFAIGFKEVDKLLSKDRSCLYLAQFIFIGKSEELTEKIEDFIPADLQHKIIYDDVFDKFNSLEGDK
ncbi:MAG: signal peptidase I [Bacilli bacterium]|nr:signal peptidase I [Bacilli bacterium]